MTAGDIESGTLARTLLGLATAGLYGMIIGVQRVELNGKAYEGDPVSPTVNLRPAPDPRILDAVHQLEAIVKNLRSIPDVAVA